MSVSVEIWEGSTRIQGNIVADAYRDDVDTALANGAHVAKERPRPGGCSWDIAKTRAMVTTMQNVLSYVYGSPKSPDLYRLQLYNGNSLDLLTNGLNQLTPSPVSADRLFVVEFGTSSSIDPTTTDLRKANNVFSYGDKQEPTTTVAGQDQLVRNTLCAIQKAGIQKFAYWSSVDERSLWRNAPWNLSERDLAWYGYWGLKFFDSSEKTLGDSIANYNNNGVSALNCGDPPQPVVALKAIYDYYVINQLIDVTWTAGDFTQLSFSPMPAAGGSTSCPTSNSAGVSISPGVDGTCASTQLPPYYAAGTYPITLTAANYPSSCAQNPSCVQSSASATVSVNVYSTPLVSRVADINNSTYLTSASTIIVTGKGFDPSGSDFIILTQPGTQTTTYRWVGDPYSSMTIPSHTSIQLSLNQLSPGQWQLSVCSVGCSSPASITIN